MRIKIHHPYYALLNIYKMAYWSEIIAMAMNLMGLKYKK